MRLLKKRKERTANWNKSEIISFLDEQYENPLEEFGAEDYEELEDKVEERGLVYDEGSDWRYEQVPELGQRDYESESVFGLVPKGKADEIESPEPWEVKFRDEEGEVQVHWKNR